MGEDEQKEQKCYQGSNFLPAAWPDGEDAGKFPRYKPASGQSSPPRTPVLKKHVEIREEKVTCDKCREVSGELVAQDKLTLFKQ